MGRLLIQRTAIALLLGGLLLPAAAWGEDRDGGGKVLLRAPQGWTRGLGVPDRDPAGRLAPLFGPGRFHIRHEISVVVASRGGETASLSRYLSRIDYALRPNLLLELDVGLETTSASGWTSEGTRFALPRFSLTYRPTRHSMLRIEYGTGGRPGASRWPLFP